MSVDVAVSLSDVQASLALFAEAIAGHPVRLEADEGQGECWPAVPSQPTRLAVPITMNECASTDANRTAYRAILLHQLVAMNEVVDQAEPDWRLVQASERELVRYVFLFLEDLRVDALTRHRYPGAVADLELLLEMALSKGPLGDGVLDLVRARCLGAEATWLRARFRMLGDAMLVAVLVEIETVDRIEATARDSLSAALSICRMLSTPGPAVGAGEDSVADPDRPQAAGDRRGASLDAGSTPTEFERSDDVGGGQPATELPVAAEIKAKSDVSSGLSVPVLRAGRYAGGRSFVYDEWDYLAGRHRRGWCRVIEERLHGDDHDFIVDVRARHAALRARIRRSFGRIRPSDLVRVHRSDDGDEVDLDAAIEAVVDRRSGAPADDRLHVRRDRAARDVATAFLLDLSASTSSPVDPDEPAPFVANPDDDPLSYAPMWTVPDETEPERRVIDVAKDAVSLMGDALHELGDQHAIYGFSGTGRDKVEFKVAKDFGDRVTPNSWAALAAMEPRHYTRMGPAIRHATTKLMSEQARTKLLIVISDGYPQDIDYGDDRRDKDYGIHDTARALADAADAGIDTFCVTIDPAGHDYLRRMCADHRYLVIDDVESLPEELAKLYVGLSSR